MKKTRFSPLVLVVVELLAALSAGVVCQDLLAVRTLPDGEVETRLRYKGFAAKETTVGKKSSIHGLLLREVTNGKQLLQLIYDSRDSLRDCDIVFRKGQVQAFLSTLNEDLNLISNGTRNNSVRRLHGVKDLPPRIRHWLHFKRLRRSCRDRHSVLKKKLKQTKSQYGNQIGPEGFFMNETRHKRSLFIAPGTHWCGVSDDALRYTELGAMSRTDRCCRRHDHCKLNIWPFTTKFRYYNGSPFTLSHCRCDGRSRRGTSRLLLVPGTEWCGRGYSADRYTRLGGFSRTDRCCRRHDTACPFWIGGFQTRWGLFNWRPNTVMHCACDERFRACLKMVDSSDANLVGKLFFNVVQTKCFVLKPKKKCARRSWWGKCEKYKYIKVAVLRDNLSY